MRLYFTTWMLFDYPFGSAFLFFHRPAYNRTCSNLDLDVYIGECNEVLHSVDLYPAYISIPVPNGVSTRGSVAIHVANPALRTSLNPLQRVFFRSQSGGQTYKAFP